MIEYPLLELQFRASQRYPPYQFLSCNQTKNKIAGNCSGINKIKVNGNIVKKKGNTIA
jgi:hypothetical protein